MRVPPSSVPALVLLAGSSVLGACSDAGFKATNAGPEAAITSHQDGDTVNEGVVTAFRGRAGDPDDARTALLVSWYANGVELCAATAPAEDGTASCAGTLPPGAVELSMEVVDPAGGAAVASVQLQVAPTGTPTVEIQAPDPAGRYAMDRLVEFRAAVSDDEDAPEALSYRLVSSLDGDLSAQVIVDSSGVVSAFLGLSEGEHALTLRATDTTGKVGTDTVILRVGPVNTAPDCAIASPADGEVIRLGVPVLLDGTVSDPENPLTDLVAVWSSDRDGELARLGPTTDGRVASRADLTPDVHAITLRVEDPDGEVCTRQVVVTVDSPPEITIDAPVDGEVVAEGAALRLQASVADLEDRAEDLLIEWESDLDGVFSMRGADASGVATVSTSGLSVGAHLLTVTVTDRYGISSSETVAVTVNGLPTSPAVNLTPSSPSTSDALTVSISGASVDPDGDPVSYRYDWYVNGVLSAASTSATLPASATTRDDTWTVVVTPTDGLHDGASASASVRIDNTAPVLASATLTPDPADVSQTLRCAPGTSSDADADVVSPSYAWTVNGVAIAATGATLAAPSFVRGDLVACVVTPTDGTDSGLPVTSNAVRIGNAAPSLAGATITPSTPYTGDTLTCSGTGWSDPDGDADASTYGWTINGVPAGTGDTLAETIERGDTVVCTITPYDGISGGTPVSTSVLVGNRAPSVTSVTISPAGARTNDTLTATATTSDPDGDVVGVSFTWTVNGVVVGTGSTLSGATMFSKGDVVIATATPNDGTDTGAAVSSSALTIGNTAPGTPTVAISPTAPAAGTDSLVCGIVSVATDADSDSLSYAISWTRNGSSWSGSTSTRTWSGDTIPAASTSASDTWVCSVRAYDGTDYGSAVTASVTIASGWSGIRTFSNCGQSGYTGPSQVQCDSAYVSTALAREVTVTSGIQRWTVPADGTYEITVTGAAGVSATSSYLGGRGARMTGRFTLTAGTVLNVLVGQMGTGAASGSNGGGGGGSFVVTSGGTLLIAAGGGGGTRADAMRGGCDATTSTSGTTGSGSSSSHSCPARSTTPGYGAPISSSSWGAGGGGFNTDGAPDTSSSWGTMGGKAFLSGGQGGMGTTGCGAAAHGGFGGGGTGNGCYGGGGGGGYSGGEGGWVAGGGGSYNGGTSQVNTAGVGTSHGSVTIDRI